MKAEQINALATGGIGFITLMVAAVGFYHNLQSTGVRIEIIILFELFFIVMVGLFMRWLKKEVEKNA